MSQDWTTALPGEVRKAWKSLLARLEADLLTQAETTRSMKELAQTQPADIAAVVDDILVSRNLGQDRTEQAAQALRREPQEGEVSLLRVRELIAEHTGQRRMLVEMHPSVWAAAVLAGWAQKIRSVSEFSMTIDKTEVLMTWDEYSELDQLAIQDGTGRWYDNLHVGPEQLDSMDQGHELYAQARAKGLSREEALTWSTDTLTRTRSVQSHRPRTRSKPSQRAQ